MMNSCEQCGCDTPNPAYCSRSCAAIVNNRKYPKRIAAARPQCAHCGAGLPRSDSKFCNTDCQHDFWYLKRIAEWHAGTRSAFKKGGCVTAWLRRWLVERYGEKCWTCGWDTVHCLSGRVPLEVDHINGNHDDDTPTNLRLICPNCHSLTPTYKGHNRGRKHVEL
jgi:hypothetical protein